MVDPTSTGKIVLHYEELTSTNDFILKWLAEDISASTNNRPIEGTVVWADKQSAGRGQFGSTWEGEAGANLTLSVIWYPTFMEARNAFFLSMAVSLSLKDACLPVCPSLSLKWPNDLYAGSKKCGGILIQTAIADARIQYAVIGIGLNVNQVAFGAHLPNATSLALESGRPVDRNALATQLFESLESRYRQLKNGSFQEIRQAYLRNLHGLNQPQTFTRLDNHRLFEGVIRGVTTEGKLEIETPAGCQLFAPKEIRQHMLPE